MLALLGVALAGVLAYAIHEALFPSFTDAAISASIVDTWQVEALVTVLLLGLLVIALSIAVVLGRVTSHLQRRLARGAVVLALVCGGVVVANHIALTNRVATLTGQSFGGFYGLQ